jgi:hypothetical protein
MLSNRIQILLVILMVSCGVANGQEGFVFEFNNPFYEDVRQQDEATYHYIRSADIRYVKKSIPVDKSFNKTIEYYYNYRCVLDSIVERGRGDKVKLTVYNYDSLYRLTSKIDSFKNSSGWDSAYRHNWEYNTDGIVRRITEGWVFYDQPGFKRYALMPEIEFDTIIGDMTRYRSGILGIRFPSDSLEQDSYLWPNQPKVYYWTRDGNLVLHSTDSIYSTMTIEETDAGYEVRYHLYRGDSSTLMRINTFDVTWEPQMSKVWYKGEWVLLEDHRYDKNGNELMNTKLDPISGVKSTTTFIRNQSNGRIEKELSPITNYSRNGFDSKVSVIEVIYTYSE